MKKLFVCLLALALALPAAGSAEWLASFFGAPASGLTLRYVAVPEAAFSAENDRVLAASPDGRFVLISNPYAVYLWDCTARRRIPISFAGEEDLELLNLYALNAALGTQGIKLNKEQREKRIADLEAVRDSYLARLGLTRFTDLDQIADCYPRTVNLFAQCTGFDGQIAAVECPQFAIAFSVDLTTGEAKLFEKGDQIMAIGSGMVLYRSHFADLATGEPLIPDLTVAADDGRPDDLTLPQGAAFCADGSVVYVSPSGAFSPEGNDYWLTHAAKDANTAYMIGNYAYSRAPGSILLSCEDRWALLYSRSAATYNPAILMNLETGEISEIEAGKLLPVAAAKNGFICWDLKTYDVVLLDPVTGEQAKISLARGFDWSQLNYAAVGSIVGNGQGMLFTQRQPLHGYFVIEGE